MKKKKIPKKSLIFFFLHVSVLRNSLSHIKLNARINSLHRSKHHPSCCNLKLDQIESLRAENQFPCSRNLLTHSSFVKLFYLLIFCPPWFSFWSRKGLIISWDIFSLETFGHHGKRGDKNHFSEKTIIIKKWWMMNVTLSRSDKH